MKLLRSFEYKRISKYYVEDDKFLNSFNLVHLSPLNVVKEPGLSKSHII